MAKIEEGMEVCDSCEVHENLLKIVNEKMPEETELYDLAELFKVSVIRPECVSCSCYLKQRCACAILQRH